ncbi:polysaccharide pyruvyl transferase family protein [Rhodococcus sp. NPDC127530]
MGGTWRFPFVPEIDVLKRVGYNAVGASHTVALGEEARSELWRVIGASSYASVRDNRTAQLAQCHGLGLPVVPDSAATLFELKRFERQRAQSPLSRGTSSGRVVVQMSRQWAEGCSAESINALNDIGLRCEGLDLLAVGLAGSHSDVLGLTLLSRRLECPTTVIIPESVDEIVSVISSARGVVASSLHVNVTAMAAGVWQIPLDGIKKLTAYMDTWGFEDESPVSGSGILDRFLMYDRESPSSRRVDRSHDLSDRAGRSVRELIERTYG